MLSVDRGYCRAADSLQRLFPQLLYREQGTQNRGQGLGVNAQEGGVELDVFTCS